MLEPHRTFLTDTSAGRLFTAGDRGAWQLAVSRETPEEGVELLTLRFSAPAPAPLPHLKLIWEFPMDGIAGQWCPQRLFDHYLRADWDKGCVSDLTHDLPLHTLMAQDGSNCFTCAVSDCRRRVTLHAGVCEESCMIYHYAELFALPEAPVTQAEVTLRFDRRPLPYYQVIREASSWLTGTPAPVPAGAYDLLYSSWYTYHQEVFDRELEAQCRLARQYGCRTIIVDDGWQTDDNHRGYSTCGDWECSLRRFPDMASHVRKVHEIGLQYMLWYSVPLVGPRSRAWKKFQGKFLYFNKSEYNQVDEYDSGVLDPRFPEVRDHLITIYENAVKAWDVDGMKLDFIDCFEFHGEDPAIRENYAGRDLKSLPEAVERLLAEATSRLRALKPEILIEFRQRYVGPAIRRYGNMLRASDCPGDPLSNRIRTTALRLTSGETAVHSDMLEWSLTDSAENAAQQLLAVLFSVPQISMKLERLPEAHQKMLHFYLDFWQSRRETLLHGDFNPGDALLNYPILTAAGKSEAVTAAYAPRLAVELPDREELFFVNATGGKEVTLHLPFEPKKTELFDATGTPQKAPQLRAGINRLLMPVSGMLHLQK